MSISAIILAAGQSKRMGQPKMVLAWENTTVLGKVLATIKKAGIEDTLVITGDAQSAIEKIAREFDSRFIHNENFRHEEMLTSIQCGLKEQFSSCDAALICLGDQPQVEEKSVRSVCAAFQKIKNEIIVPSHQKRRGHPWLIPRVFWDEVLRMRAPESMRNFLDKHKNEIHYIECETSSILQDLDTPEDYLKYRP
jgi:molybdenum cofactor cytidylyltransferase